MNTRVIASIGDGVMIGGLGVGATLAGALGVLSDAAEVVVVERVSGVVDVAREREGAALADPRVRIGVADVADAVERAADLSAVLLDVDSGPGWASFRDNARLYCDAGIARVARARRPDGLFAVWSGYQADGFTRVLRAAGLRPEIVPLLEGERVRARAYVGYKH